MSTVASFFRRHRHTAGFVAGVAAAVAVAFGARGGA